MKKNLFPFWILGREVGMNAKNSKLLILPKQKVKMLGLFYNRIDNLQNIMFVVFR